MIYKLKSLKVRFTSIEVSKKITLLENLERITGVLPKDYHDFLLYFGSNVKFDAIVIFKGIESSPWADDKGFDTIDYFYGLNNINNEYTIFEMIETYKNDLEMKLIPIGFSSGGNQICICTQRNMKGTIWFWDHEEFSLFKNEQIVSGLTLVAHDFKEFIDKLEIENNISPSKAIGGYLDF
ncbi:SMI1/KNR4 family protein [Proteus sp. FME41]|uniref:SMI1/KNR4 family protein n=1 Tax=Proteus sp. FME41 TaxID=2742608 RepID=UPI001865C85A|nr:SMI1/KNR4 family protein [Proteus sp. FME41]